MGSEPPSSTRASRVRELAANLALAGATVVVFLAAAEIVARLCEPRTRPSTADYITSWQAWDGEFYTVKSTAIGWPPWEDYNTEGLRDREHAIEKRPGSWRVACLGDSVTLGWGLRPRQAWPQVLEELAAASGRDLEVMNIALGGWSTRQELIAYHRIARRYHPDQVLIGICLNDIPEMQNNLSRPPALVTELHRRSALVRRLVGAERREIGRVEELFTVSSAAKVRHAYALVFADLRQLRDEVRADGSSLSVLVFPFRFQVAPLAPAPIAQRTIADFCRAEGIPLLDLLPAVATIGNTAFHDYDHFSVAGARLVARQILESGLIADTLAGSGAGGARGPSGVPAAPAGDWRTLITELQAPLESERAAAAHGLARLGDDAASAVPALAAALDDRSRVVRAAAVWALGDIGSASAPAVPALRRLARQQDPFLRAGALFALGGIGAPARVAVPEVVALLDDGDERVRWRAAEALGKIGVGAESVDALERLVADPASPARGLAAEALGRLGGDARSALPVLITATTDRRPDVRWRVVWALGRIGPAARPAVLALRTALADGDVRWRAAEALGGIGPGAADAVPDLVGLLKDPSSNVRWRAAVALGAIGAPQAFAALLGSARDTAENVRLASLTALGSIAGDPSVLASVWVKALSDPDDRIRLQATRGLGRLKTLSPAARRALAAAGKDPNPDVRAQAVKVLRKRGS